MASFQEKIHEIEDADDVSWDEEETAQENALWMQDEADVPKSTLPSTMSRALVPFDADKDIESQLNRFNALPMLTAEEEKALAERLQNHADLAAAQRLVLAHMRYVVRIARSYQGYGLPTPDLVQEGTIGLMKAVKRFDPGMGVRLVSFAVHWIKAEIHEYVIRNWRIVKIATTKAQRKLFFKLRSQKKRLGWFKEEEIQQVAHDLGVTRQDVIEMEKRLNAEDWSLEGDSADDQSAPVSAPIQYLKAPDDDPLDHLTVTAQEERSHAALEYALKTLDARSIDIIQLRYLPEDDAKITLKDLAKTYGVSIERVRQIEQAALKKLKTAMLAYHPDLEEAYEEGR